MEAPQPPNTDNNSPAFILMQMKNSDDRVGASPSSSSSFSSSSPSPSFPPPPSHKLSHILSQSPHSQNLHTPLPPSSTFNFNYMPPINPINSINPMNPMNSINSINSINSPPQPPPHMRLSIPRLSLPIQRPSSAPGSPNTPHSSTSSSSPSTPSTPISSPRGNTNNNNNNSMNSSGNNINSNSGEIRKQSDCKLRHCLLCERGQPALLVKAPTWASIMRVVFYCLKYDMNEKHYFSLKTDVYSFMLAHWDKLCLNKKKSDNWHKQIQDMLSHSKNLFESGMDKYKQNGFWRLKTLTDPWSITKDRSPRKGSDPPTRDSSSDDELADVEHEAPDRSPKRVKMELSQDDAVMTQEDSERQRKLETEVSNLRLQLHNMTDTLVGLKEELKQREDSLQSQREAYDKLTEEFCVLQILAQREVQRETGANYKPTTTQMINNIIHANNASSSPSSSPFPYPPSSAAAAAAADAAQGNHPFSFSQQELRKLEELKRAEEMRKIDEIRATMATTGSLPMHKLEELRGNFVFSNYILPPKVEELRNSPRTPRDGSPRDMSRDPSPRTDGIASPRELVMRDGSPRPDLLRSGELPIRESQLPLREGQLPIRDSARMKRDSPRSSPRGSPRMTHGHPNPASPLARERSNSNPSSRELIHPSLSLNSPRDGYHLNSPRDVLLLATSNLSLNSPREHLTSSGGINSNNGSNSSGNANNPTGSGFYFAPPANSPRDLLSINNILNNHSSSASSSSASDIPSDSSKFPPHIPQINLRNLHSYHHSPPGSPIQNSTTNNLNDSAEMRTTDGRPTTPPNNNSNSSNSTNPNRLSPLHQVLPQYIPKPRSPTPHDHSSPSPPPSHHLLQQMHQHQLLQMYQLQQQQLQQQQQQHLQQQQQHLQQHQLQQLHQQYQLQMQHLQQEHERPQ